MDKQSLELLLAQGVSIEQIARRFGKDPSTISYWVRKHALKSQYADKHTAKGGIERSTLETLVHDGKTIAEIADEVERSKATVRHWLRRYGLKTQNARGRRPGEARRLKEVGLLNVTMVCPHHGSTGFSLEGRGYYRCKRCRSEAVTRRRRKVKEILVSEAGGACVLCGYDRCTAALEFHHVDPRAKRMHVSADGNGVALATLRAEARKCVLLCSNCHVEIEHGHAVLPATVPSAEAKRIHADPG